MEPIEPTKPILPVEPQPDMVITAEAKYFLHTAGRWASFLGVLGFIVTGLLTLIAIFAGTMTTILSRLNIGNSDGMSGVATPVQIVFLLPIVLLYFFISYYLYQFGTRIKTSTTFNDSTLATKAFSNLKSHFKIIGITSIVAISIYILIIICVFIAYIFVRH
jgi:hypothetical protein